MRKLLAAVNGSAQSDRAVHYVIDLARHINGHGIEVHLVNVQPPITDWQLTGFLKHERITEIQQRHGEEALASARALLEAAGIPYHAYARLGPVAPSIADCADEIGCDEIVMGTRGPSRLERLLAAPLEDQVLAHARQAITLVP